MAGSSPEFTTIQEGQQLSAGLNGVPSGGGLAVLTGSPDVNAYAQYTCNPKLGLKSHQFVNGNCYALPTSGYGSGRTPYLPGPMYWGSDATIVKNFNVTEKQKVEIRFAAFNFLNHSLLSFNNGDSNLTVNNNLTDSSHACPGSYCSAFGYANYQYGQRVLEFAGKYSF